MGGLISLIGWRSGPSSLRPPGAHLQHDVHADGDEHLEHDDGDPEGLEALPRRVADACRGEQRGKPKTSTHSALGGQHLRGRFWTLNSEGGVGLPPPE